MRIFTQRKKPSENASFVGAYISKDVTTYLALYTIAYGTSKSPVFREQMERWYQEMEKQLPMSRLITKIVLVACQEWETQAKRKTPVSSSQFLARLKKELESRGLPELYVTEIIQKFKDGKNKDHTLTEYPDEAPGE